METSFNFNKAESTSREVFKIFDLAPAFLPPVFHELFHDCPQAAADLFSIIFGIQSPITNPKIYTLRGKPFSMHLECVTSLSANMDDGGKVNAILYAGSNSEITRIYSYLMNRFCLDSLRIGVGEFYEENYQFIFVSSNVSLTETQSGFHRFNFDFSSAIPGPGDLPKKKSVQIAFIEPGKLIANSSSALPALLPWIHFMFPQSEGQFEEVTNSNELFKQLRKHLKKLAPRRN